MVHNPRHYSHCRCRATNKKGQNFLGDPVGLFVDFWEAAIEDGAVGVGFVSKCDVEVGF